MLHPSFYRRTLVYFSNFIRLFDVFVHTSYNLDICELLRYQCFSFAFMRYSHTSQYGRYCFIIRQNYAYSKYPRYTGLSVGFCRQTCKLIFCVFEFIRKKNGINNYFSSYMHQAQEFREILKIRYKQKIKKNIRNLPNNQ